MTTQSVIGKTFVYQGWYYTVIRKAVRKPDSMVYCKCEHYECAPQHTDVWLHDLKKATEV